ncbi:hypothetical protein VYU27_010345 [Nannochloropsis oceanica]
MVPPSPSPSSSSSSSSALLASLRDELRRIDEDVARSLVKVDKSMETWREELKRVIGCLASAPLPSFQEGSSNTEEEEDDFPSLNPSPGSLWVGRMEAASAGMEGGREGALLLLQRLQWRCEGIRERVRKLTRIRTRKEEQRGEEGGAVKEGREGAEIVSMEALLKQGEGHDGFGFISSLTQIEAKLDATWEEVETLEYITASVHRLAVPSLGRGREGGREKGRQGGRERLALLSLLLQQEVV